MRLPAIIMPTVGAAVIALALGLSACAGNETALKTAKVTLSAYETTQQAVILYGGLDTCPKSAPFCKNQETWDKIKIAETVATTAIVEATPVLNGTEADLGQALKAYEAVEKMKDAFIEANAKLKQAKLDAAAAAAKPVPALKGATP